ncbi:hypothetical protein QZH41_018125, partial [Actinostola sp. cb2023]
MGIHGLSKLLGDIAPSGMKENEIKNYFGDHLMGMFYRTIRMVENGIKPVYVFDGKPPQMKSGELAKRTERRQEAQKALEKAEEAGETENIDKFSKRLVRVTKEHSDECKKLLKLMGIPYVEAPCEAEAQCAELVKSGKVYATGTEDMDALTFGTTVMLRHLTFSEAKYAINDNNTIHIITKMPIKEYHLVNILSEAGLTQEEFIDLGILLGCDYCDSIKGSIGPKRAIDLIKQHRSIEEILKHLDSTKYPPPENWLFKEARELFKNPDILPASEVELKWQDPDETGLITYMAEEKGFSEDRIRSGIKKLTKARHGSTQGRLDSFFTVLPSNTPKRKV